MKKNSTEIIILEMAAEEFLTKGYDGARTTSIAQAAGVTHAMLHYYYRSKEQLFERILEDKIAEFTQAITDGLSQDTTTSMTAKIEHFTGMYFDYIGKDPRLPLFIITEVLPVTERRAMMQEKMSHHAQNFFSSFANDFNKAIDNGEIAEMNPTDLFIDIISLNLFSISSCKLVTSIINVDEESYLKRRREENIRTIIKRITPLHNNTQTTVVETTKTKSNDNDKPKDKTEVQSQPTKAKEETQQLDLFTANNIDLFGNNIADQQQPNDSNNTK